MSYGLSLSPGSHVVSWPKGEAGWCCRLRGSGSLFWRQRVGHLLICDSFTCPSPVIAACVCRYGDIVPITTAGRVTIMLMMATALLTIPRMMNKLVFVLSKQSTYVGRPPYPFSCAQLFHIHPPHACPLGTLLQRNACLHTCLRVHHTTPVPCLNLPDARPRPS